MVWINQSNADNLTPCMSIHTYPQQTNRSSHLALISASHINILPARHSFGSHCSGSLVLEWHVTHQARSTYRLHILTRLEDAERTQLSSELKQTVLQDATELGPDQQQKSVYMVTMVMLLLTPLPDITSMALRYQ